MNGPVPLYKRVFSLLMLRYLAIGCFVLAIALAAIGIGRPMLFDNDTARFMFCMLIATLLAVFFFIFYPDNMQVNLPLAVGTTVRLAGPVALWFATFLLLLQYAPSSESGRLFRIVGQEMYMEDVSMTNVSSSDGAEIQQWLVAANSGSKKLYGIYVVFPKNKRSIHGVLKHEGWSNPIEVTLTRDGPNTIDVSSATEKGSK